jgi:hypothetical protein
MEIIGVVDRQRTWHHSETPQGKASAAAYRTGCPCEECRQLHIDYMKSYHQGQVANMDDADGTTTYHAHKGQPSNRTAIKWGCLHPRCLNLAGLYIDPDNTVRWKADGTVAAKFGIPKEPAA